MRHFILLTLLVRSLVIHAESTHGVFRLVIGDVQIKSFRTGETGRARLGGEVFAADVITTAENARAKIVMIDTNEINIGPKTTLAIQHYEFDPAAGKKDVLLNVIYGKVRAKVEQKYDASKGASFQIKTPGAVAGVRGTDFLVSFDPASKRSEVTTFQGEVAFGLPGPGNKILNAVTIAPGHASSSFAGQPPSAPINVPKTSLNKMDVDSRPAESKPAEPPPKPSAAQDRDSGSRQPASVGSPASTLRPEDFADSSARPMPPAGLVPVAPPGAPFVAPRPPALPTCDFCNQAILSGSAKVLVHLKNLPSQ